MEIVWRPQGDLNPCRRRESQFVTPRHQIKSSPYSCMAVQKVHGYTQCGTQDSTQKKAPQLTSLQGKGYNHLEKKLPAFASIVKGVGA